MGSYYRIQYVGAGKVRVLKVFHEGAEFGRVQLDAKDNRYHTEHVPGWTGLNFEKNLWEQFVNDKSASQVTIIHPGWSCVQFETFLRNQSSTA